ncbi:hypothetical protein [Gaoshiqia sp. Z1-71]|uniref:hypothetical protein n=1 Tax=Gaoshiqia hydrogeniformans TaxID=3290090 RepID=UPI003BF9012C
MTSFVLRQKSKSCPEGHQQQGFFQNGCPSIFIQIMFFFPGGAVCNRAFNNRRLKIDTAGGRLNGLRAASGGID